jgi:hypothetical protein
MSAATGGADTGVPAAFLIMGHGMEKLIDFKERPTLPSGYTLVTFAQCGAVTDYDVVIPFITKFVDDSVKEGLQTAAHETLRSNNIFGKTTPYHIYREGDRIPDLEAQLFVNMEEEGTPFGFMKSGVYRLGDTELSDWVINPTHLSPTLPYKQEQWMLDIPVTSAKKIKKTDAITMIPPTFAKSLYPTKEVAETTIRSMTGDMIAKDALIGHPSWRISLQDILKRFGPGVYYWPVCRGIQDTYHLSDYIKGLDGILFADQYSTFTARYKPYLYRNYNLNVTDLATINALLLENSKNPNIPDWFKIDDLPTLRRTLGITRGKVAIVREKSKEQQGSRGGARRTKTRRRGRVTRKRRA